MALRIRPVIAGVMALICAAFVSPAAATGAAHVARPHGTVIVWSYNDDEVLEKVSATGLRHGSVNAPKAYPRWGAISRDGKQALGYGLQGVRAAVWSLTTGAVHPVDDVPEARTDLQGSTWLRDGRHVLAVTQDNAYFNGSQHWIELDTITGHWTLLHSTGPEVAAKP